MTSPYLSAHLKPTVFFFLSLFLKSKFLCHECQTTLNIFYFLEFDCFIFIAHLSITSTGISYYKKFKTHCTMPLHMLFNTINSIRITICFKRCFLWLLSNFLNPNHQPNFISPKETFASSMPTSHFHMCLYYSDSHLCFAISLHHHWTVSPWRVVRRLSLSTTSRYNL